MSAIWWTQFKAIIHKNFLLSYRNKWDWIIFLAIPVIILSGIYIFVSYLFIQTVQVGMIKLSLTLTVIGYQRTILIREVTERNDGFGDYLKIMGLNKVVLLAANLSYSYVLCGISFSIILFGVLAESFLKIDDLTFLLFIAQILFIISSINFTFLISLLFKSAKLAGDLGILLILALHFLTWIEFFLESPYFFATLLWTPQIAFLYSISLNKTHQIVGFLCLTLQSLLYILLYIYLDNVIPNANGVKKHPLYCLKKKNHNSRSLYEESDSQHLLFNHEVMQKTSAFYQDSSINQDTLPTIYINKLTKKFNSFCAINNISFGLYENEVLCLLGHNGAGKTTLINLLCNIYQPTSGSIISQQQNMIDKGRSMKFKIGFCSQMNFLYDNMTIAEHLEMMVEIKGITTKDEIHKISSSIGIVEYQKKKPHQLSCGNKRKTCLAMALLGKPEIILLDEPTSGLDPVSRSLFWDAIFNIKKSVNAIVLTTHHLEEAETLADKLAIISSGCLIAYGTPQYVKKVFSEGYTLTVTIDDADIQIDKIKEKIDKVKQIIAKFVKNVKFNLETSTNSVVCILPFSELQQFSLLFEELEIMNDTKINITQNTLEETFMSIEEKEEEVLAKYGIISSKLAYKKLNVKLDNNNLDEFFKIGEEITFLRLISSIFKKRLLLSIREPEFYIIIGISVALLSILIWIFWHFVLKKFSNGLELFNFNDYLCISYYFIIFSYTFVSSLYVYTPVKEREVGIRHLLRLSGCYPTAYFLGHFLADILIHSISCILIYCLICILWVCSNKLVLFQEIQITIIFFFVTFLFGCEFILFSYTLGFIFSRSASAIQFFNLLIYGIFAVTCMIFFPFEMMLIDQSTMLNLTLILHQLFSPFIVWIYAGFFKTYNKKACSEFHPANPCVFIAISLIQIIFLFFICIWIENRKFKCKKTKVAPTIVTDDMIPLSILNEKRTLENSKNNFKVRVQKLYKTYQLNNQDTNYAVSNASFGIEKNSIFGLLGPNGAGKSTIINILTSKIPKSFGKILINDLDLDSWPNSDTYKSAGYCSQDNIYWKQFTVYEHLSILALLKGLPSEKVNYLCSYLICLMNLHPYIYKKAGQLSGGNKRKLCLCMAIISNPQLLFLDEPSTGIDAIGKKCLWDIIKLAKTHNKSSVVLTTHNLYEAEFLCDKIGIMINGMFQCIGTGQELKKMHDGGYKLIIQTKSQKCKKNVANIDLAIKLNEIVPNAQLQPSKIEGELVFKISKNMFRLGVLFKEMEKWKENYWCDDYSLLEGTLESVFIELCQKQNVSVKQSYELLKNNHKTIKFACQLRLKALYQPNNGQF